MMAKAEEKMDQAPVKEETPSMEDILQSIRGVISGDEASTESEDILELTDVVEEVTQVSVAGTPAGEDVPEKSILDDIDDALGDTTSAESKEKVAEVAAAEAAKLEAEAAEAAKLEAEAQAAKVEAEALEVKSKAEAEVAAAAAAIIQNDSQTSSEGAMNTQVNNDDALEADFGASNISVSAELGANGANGRLLDEEVAKESSGSLKALVDSVHEKHIVSPNTRGGTSLEELVIEAMKPFLADWLNKNLPAIVKKIVEKEVKRLIPKEEDDY